MTLLCTSKQLGAGFLFQMELLARGETLEQTQHEKKNNFALDITSKYLTQGESPGYFSATLGGATFAS